MDRSRLELAPGICLDARCAVFLADTGTLAVADLHLGYAWAHRARGNLLPICAGDDTLPRLRELIDDYAPREVALLGDIVHAAVRAEPLLDELRALAALAERVPLRLIAGNHDAQLQRLLQQSAIGLTLARELVAEPHLLLHGDSADEILVEDAHESARFFIALSNFLAHLHELFAHLPKRVAHLPKLFVYFPELFVDGRKFCAHLASELRKLLIEHPGPRIDRRGVRR